MRYIGIDFGTKRIGVALSDESNHFALPYKVLPNSKKIIEDIKNIIADNNVTHIILGESKDYKGQDNKVMEKIRKFKTDIENNLHVPVIFEPEMLTSREAEHIQGKTDMLDASAAALILKSYLDRLS